MTIKLLDRIAGREGLNGHGVSEESEIDDLGAFGFLRGSKERAICLELRKRNGDIEAIGYAWIPRFSFNPSIGITLQLPDYKIIIKGRNLNVETLPKVRLFESLCRHRVPWIQESDMVRGMMASEGTTLIESIEW